MRRLVSVVGVVVACAALGAAVASGERGSAAGGKLQVVAAENFWGSIAAAARRLEGVGDEHHRQPGHRSALLSAERR